MMTKVKSIKHVGKQQTYDLEINHEDHQFYLANGALTSNSHATAYAITSYQCAYLLTHYPDEWVASYIDFSATEKGKITGKEDPLSVALAECKGLGYTLGKPDINLSEPNYQVKDKVLVPSFRALKHLGWPAIREIEQYRPYKTIEDLLWNSDGSWRHSKFSKKSLSTLVRLGALDSMDLVGPDKLLKNYRQLYYVIVENYDNLKRAASRIRHRNHRELLMELAIEASKLPDWDLGEKINTGQELAGYVDINYIMTPEIRSYLKSNGIKSIDEYASEKEIYWAIVKHSVASKTKNGQTYLRMKIYGDSTAEHGCFVWGFNPEKYSTIPDHTLVLSRYKHSDFGFSAFISQLEIIGRS